MRQGKKKKKNEEAPSFPPFTSFEYRAEAVSKRAEEKQKTK